MDTWLIPTLALLLLITLQGLLYLRRQRRQARTARQCSSTLQLALELLQNLQKHRGLGSLSDTPSLRQRNEIARQLDQLWQRWQATTEQLAELASRWPVLRAQPADFNGHCLLIEQVLTAIQLLELRLGVSHNGALPGLSEACRGLEDLGRLRALSVRAANHPRCPLELQIQMRYLCQRLAGPSCEQRVRQVIERLDRDLIGAAQIRLAPMDCFTLLTPLIDERLQGMRARLA